MENRNSQGSLYTASAVSGPTLKHLAGIAEKHGLDISDDDLEVYHRIIKDSCDTLNDVDLLPEPALPTKYPRTPGYRPTPEENVLNAWYWKTCIIGAQTGKIAGKKVAVKDNIAVAGVPMMVGCSALEGYVPEFDATVVTRVLDEGGKILGKSTCESLCASGASFTCNKGPVLNYRNPLHDAGGSSGGSATLVASGEVDLAIGSDQGGSVRLPASWCGIVGLKPTHGLIPYTGAMCFEASVDHLGPLTSNVYDCALMLEVLAGYDDGLDPRQRQDMVVPKYTTEMHGDNLDGIKIGIVNEGFGCDGADSKVEDLVRKSVGKLSEVGATVTDISIPLHKLGSIIWKQIYAEGFTDTVFKTGEYLNRLGKISVNTRSANLTGHPSISVNAGFLHGGLPVGAMFTGRHFGEGTLLKVADKFEKLVGK